jgi:uncharacterized protein with HEPN domain
MRATTADRVGHMRAAIAQIRALTLSATAEDFQGDPVRRAALERFFEIVSEASRHIPYSSKARHSEVPWRRIADLGNQLRHGYDGVDIGILLTIARRELGALEEAVDAIFADISTGDCT